jgi:hypothetical protein
MPKDALGHGSNPRGGAANDNAPHDRAIESAAKRMGRTYEQQAAQVAAARAELHAPAHQSGVERSTGGSGGAAVVNVLALLTKLGIGVAGGIAGAVLKGGRSHRQR